MEDAIVTPDDINDTFDGVETVADVRVMLEETDSIYTIQFLYPLVGSLPILLSFGKFKIFKHYLNNEKDKDKSKALIDMHNDIFVN